MEEIVRAVLESVRPAFQANGADLEIGEVGPETIKLRLVFGPNACRTCVLPPETITPTLEGLLAGRLGHPVRVIVEEVDGESNP